MVNKVNPKTAAPVSPRTGESSWCWAAELKYQTKGESLGIRFEEKASSTDKWTRNPIYGKTLREASMKSTLESQDTLAVRKTGDISCWPGATWKTAADRSGGGRRSRQSGGGRLVFDSPNSQTWDPNVPKSSFRVDGIQTSQLLGGVRANSPTVRKRKLSIAASLRCAVAIKFAGQICLRALFRIC